MSTRTGTFLEKISDIRVQMNAKLEEAYRRREAVDAEIADLKRVIRTAEQAERNLKEV